jgi:energy-coupling factor transporter ATP-binding protein EcfA2
LATTPSACPPPLLDNELVDDRSLEAFDGDSFGHGDFVRELAGVVLQASAPANIALFGAWGSGKSSIANLLKKQLPPKNSEVRFVVFDASKYAEAPLRRHFISQVAHGLDIKDSDYHDGLYTGVETRDVKFRPGEFGKLTGAFLIAVLLTLLVLVAIASGVAALQVGDFEPNWSRNVKDYLLATLPVAAVITAFIKLAGDGFHLKTTKTAPSGDEEFERVFKELVKEAKTKRLVVFVDELDRCSPAQVASTLETLKTFLFVEGCVFVVAADQQVLEQALRRKVRQHTPEDTSNPYYSAGSSYLDKVFQYQLTLPPLRAPTLSRFALSLVRGEPGVWERVPQLDEAVSVLIPTHVVSPRRVKVLLNRFAITYRLAERRAAEGRLDPDLGARATELAKLVCLQAEFPLFAEDLTLDGRLPQLVRMAAEGEEMPANVRPEVLQRVVAYAKGQRIVAELLVEPQPTGEDDQDAVEQTPTTAPDDDAEGDSEDGESREVDTRAKNRGDEVARQHAQQLLAYLRKTRHVAGPAPDLLYLESAGAGHGIDAVLADRLQRAALDNDISEVLALVASASGDGQGRGALLVLADVVRQAQPGIEGRNVVSAVLQGIERSGVELGDAADPIGDAVAGHLAQADLQAEDLKGALALSGASNRTVGPWLLEAVLRHPASRADVEVATSLVGRAEGVPEELQMLLAQAAATALLQNASQAAERLAALPLSTVHDLLVNAKTPLKRASDEHYAAVKAMASERVDADEGAILDPSPAEALASGLDDVIAQGRLDVGNEVIHLMLLMDHEQLRYAVSSRLDALAPLVDTTLIRLVLSATDRRALNEWHEWLDPVDAQVVGEDQGLQEYIDALACKWWDKVNDDSPPSASDAEHAVVALARCAEHSSISNDIRRRVAKALDEPFATTDAIAQQDEALVHADRLVVAELLDLSALADIRLGAALQTLNASVVGAVRVAEVSAALTRRVGEAAPAASKDALQQVLDAAPESLWLPDAVRARVLLTAAAPLHAQDASVASPVPLDELRELAANRTDESSTDMALSVWLENFATDPEEVWQVLEPLVDDELPAEVRRALGLYAQGIGDSGRFALVEKALDRLASQPVDQSFLEAAHLSEVPAHKVADRLVELLAAAEDTETRRRVMGVWQQLSPTGETVRRRLVEKVYLPLVATGDDDDLDLALSYFGLVASVKGVRKPVRAALRAGARTDGQKRRVDKLLQTAKWTKKSVFGLGPSIDQDD